MCLFLLPCDLFEVQGHIFFHAVFAVLYTISAHKEITKSLATLGTANVCNINGEMQMRSKFQVWKLDAPLLPCLVPWCFFFLSVDDNVGPQASPVLPKLGGLVALLLAKGVGILSEVYPFRFIFPLGSLDKHPVLWSSWHWRRAASHFLDARAAEIQTAAEQISSIFIFIQMC